MADEKKPIDTRWEVNSDDLKAAMMEEINNAFGDNLYTVALEKWFNKELAHALVVFIAEEGVVDITFEGGEPVIKFWADGAQYDELTRSKRLAGTIEEMIETWGGDISDDQCGGGLRRKLRRLREVLLVAVDKIDTTLLPYGKE
jgi:hypothetical protein